MIRSDMAFSWAAYRRNVPRYPHARLVLMSSICLFISAVPWLEGFTTPYGTMLGLLAGLAFPALLRRWITARPERTQKWLLVHGLSLGLFGYFRDLIAEPVLLVSVGAVCGAWIGIWFTLYSDDQVVREPGSAIN